MSASCLGWIWTWSSLKDRRDQWVPVWPLQNRYTHITSHLQNSDRWSKTGRSSLWIQQTKTVSSSSSFNRCLFSHSHIQRTNCLKGSLNLEIRCKEWLQSNGAGKDSKASVHYLNITPQHLFISIMSSLLFTSTVSFEGLLYHFSSCWWYVYDNITLLKWFTWYGNCM